MVGGIVLLAAFTSVLTATLTAEQVAGKIHGPKDLVGRTVGCQEAAVSVLAVKQRGGVVQEFTTTPEAIDALALGTLADVLPRLEKSDLPLLDTDAMRDFVETPVRYQRAFLGEEAFGLAVIGGCDDADACLANDPTLTDLMVFM